MPTFVGDKYEPQWNYIGPLKLKDIQKQAYIQPFLNNSVFEFGEASIFNGAGKFQGIMKKNSQMITGLGRQINQCGKLNQYKIIDGMFKEGLKHGYIREIGLFPPQFYIDDHFQKFDYIERGHYNNGKKCGEFLR